jgi:hypothetical protein
MIEDGMTGFQFRKELPHARFKAGYVAYQQLVRTRIHLRHPFVVIDSSDVDVMSQDELLYRFQDVDA